LLIVLISWPHS